MARPPQSSLFIRGRSQLNFVVFSIGLENGGLMRGQLGLRAAGIALALVTTVAPLSGEEPVGTLEAIEGHVVSMIERVEPSIVSIIRGRSSVDRLAAGRINPFGIAPQGIRLDQTPDLTGLDFVPDEFGAGVVIADSKGGRFILTNQHVVEGGPVADGSSDTTPYRLYVRLHDGRGFFTQVHAADPRSDLAVLRIDYEAIGDSPPESPEDFPPALPMAKEESYRKGEFVFVFGNPYGLARDGSASVGWGMIGNVLRRPAPVDPLLNPNAQADETIHHYGTLLQLDCRVDLGFSGGATVNRRGELVGLTTALSAIEGYESTAGFAIPIEAGTRRIIERLVQGQEPEYGFLGIEPRDINRLQLRAIAPSLAARGGAVRAQAVKSGSPAARAGLLSGDIILSLDGRSVESTLELMRQVGFAGPGAEMALEVVRVGGGRRELNRQTLRATLDKWPVVNDTDLVTTVPSYEPWRGLHVDYATARQRFVSPRLEPYPEGVVVLAAEDAIGGDEPVKAGDFITHVNGESIESPQGFYRAVREAASVTLQLADGRQITVR